MILLIKDDFDLTKIADSGQCFRWSRCSEAWRIVAGGDCLYITDLGDGRYEADCVPETWDGFWRDYFDLGTSYRKIRERIDPALDPFLWEAAEQERGIRILRQNPWEMLITFIISQNRNIPAIRRSVELLAETCGEARTDRRGETYYTFPSPQALAALTEEELKACRLGYRCRYVHAAAEAAAAGDLDPEALCRMGDSEAMAQLTGLLGVGIKVASCVALFGLHHTDAFPVDVWMKRVLAEQYPEGYPYERYAPWNGVCQQYLFAHYRHKAGRADIEPAAEDGRSAEGRAELEPAAETGTAADLGPEAFAWTREPAAWSARGNRVSITTKPHTDLWQRTYYHFRNDNAPVFQTETDERYFSFVVRTDFAGSRQRFDQCGIVLYLDSENWLKASVEYENASFRHLGSVVTNHGWSDWATTEIPAEVTAMWYRLSRREDDYRIECSEDGVRWKQMRICHLAEGAGRIRFGIYACSPEDSSFTAEFTDLRITPCAWQAHDGQQPDADV